MAVTTYDISVGVFLRMLTNCRAFLGKAQSFAESQGISPEDLLQRRLAPDMFGLARQVQIAIDGAWGSAARLAGLDPSEPEARDYAVFNRGDDFMFGPDARSFAELSARIDAACAALRDLPRDVFDRAGNRSIVLQMDGRTRHFQMEGFILHYILPNFYFHLATAYAILRHAGVDLGKEDFEGPPVYTAGLAGSG